MWMAFLDRLYAWSDITVLFGLNLLVQSTLIILVGLTGAYILRIRRKGAAAQSFLLRTCLACVILAPLAFLVFSALGIHGLRFETPLHGTRSVSMASTSVSRQTSSVSSNIQGEQSGRGEMTASPLSAPEKRPSARSIPHQAVIRPHASAMTSGDIVPYTPASASRETTKSRNTFHDVFRYLPVCISLAWVFFAFFLALRAGAITLYIHRIRNLSFPLLPHHAILGKNAADELGIAPPPILQSPYVSSALLAGVFRPVILIPSGGDENLMATREVFLHEFAHLSRRDPLWLHLCQLAKILFPFQPLLWVLSRHIEELSDYACDDYVIRHTGGNRMYASMLLDFARTTQLRNVEVSAGSGILSSRFPLARRIQRILDNSYSRHITVSANEAMSFTVIFLCAVTLSGFVGFRGENADGTAVAAEHHSRQGGNSFHNMVSRLHVPLTAPLAALTMEKQEADAALHGKGSELTPERGKPTPAAEQNTHSGPASIPAVTVPAASLIPQAAPDSRKVPDSPLEQMAVGEEIAQSIIPESADTSVSSAAVEDSTDSRPEKTAESLSKTASRDSLHTADRLELSSAAAPMVATAGQLKIAIPNSCTEALREALEQGQENPVWSPSGQVIAFTGSGGKGVWVVSITGGKPKLVYNNTNDQTSGGSTAQWKGARTLSFTPDGKGLTILSYKQITSAGGAAKEAATGNSSLIPVIEIIDLASGDRSVIAENVSDGCWSPDGKHFAYVDADYYGITVLDTTTGIDNKITESGGSPCFTPDGSSVLYVDMSGGVSNRLIRTPLSGGAPVLLSGEGFWWNPKVSPDGEWVLSSDGASDYGQYSRMLAYNLKTARMYDILIPTSEAVLMGDWSPNGRQFCYTHAQDGFSSGGNVQKSAIFIENFSPRNLDSQETSVSAQPVEFKIVGNFPNPFNPSTTIQFSLPAEGFTELYIYGMNGQKIRELVSRSMPAGMHSIIWNGRDQKGSPVSSGVYFARLKMHGKVESRRMTLVK